MQEPTNAPNKPKYCCLCAHKGHVAEQCNRANREPGPLGVHVSNYRQLLNMPKTSEPNTAAKCTILASGLNDYTFNFGNDIVYTGNSIYARFRRAVNMDKLDQSGASDNDVIIMNSSNLHDTSDRPIEVYDDMDFEMDDLNLDNVSSSDNFSLENTLDKSNISLNNTNDSDNYTNISDSLHEISQLDGQIRALNELKDKMYMHRPNANADYTCQSTESTDQDQSESTDFDTSVCEQKDTVTTSTERDFIPLSSGEPERFEPTRSPSPVSADSTTNANEKSDATIHLTEQHCKYLLNEKGNQFLRNSESQYEISVRLEWRQFGNVLVVHGISNAQQNFHRDLKEFFNSTEKVKQSLSVCNSMPKNRTALIQFVREKVVQLDSPFCNSKHYADVPGNLSIAYSSCGYV